jgi:hypothetical protein
MIIVIKLIGLIFLFLMKLLPFNDEEISERRLLSLVKACILQNLEFLRFCMELEIQRRRDFGPI